MSDIDIKCPYCGAQSQKLARVYNKKAGGYVDQFQCLDNPKEHRFELDREGNVISDDGCQRCGD